MTISSWLNVGRRRPPGRGLRRGEILGSALLQPACSVCISLSAFFHIQKYRMLSVIWHGWLGGRKGIQPVKTKCWFADGDFTTEFWLLPLPSISSLLSLHFNGHSPGQPGLAGAKDDGSGGDSYRSCKAPVKSSPPTNQHQVFFYRPDALPVAQPTVSKHGRENITSHGLAYPKLTKLFQLCLSPLIAPGYLGVVCHASHQPSDASTPPSSPATTKSRTALWLGVC